MHEEHSVDLIIRTHEIMMANSYDSSRSKEPVPAVVGRYASATNRRGWYQFVPFRVVSAAVAELVEVYNNTSSSLGHLPFL